MEKIQAPKKERKFLKAVVNIAKVLANELVMGIARKFIGKAIDKVGNKRQGLVIASVILASTFAFAQYPATTNKQRLGYQTTGDGLLFRGRASDTMSIKSSGLNNAYFILDTVNNVVYNYIKTKGGWLFNNSDTIIVNNNFIQPIDSLFFKTSIPTNNVDTAKMRWDSDLGTVVLGMYDKVPNELGFKNFWLVKNQTGSTITKGSIVYANGTVGASGRITVAKFIANGSIDAKYLLGITAHDLSNGEDGYVISFGKIRQVNTDTFAAGSILYPSPITAGVWTDVEPVAPNIDMPIGFCINSSSNNGTIAIRVLTGSSLRELHDVSITSPVEKSSLYYSGGLWRDTTASLLLSDTAAMLTPYLRKLDTVSLSNRINLKLNISDTASMLTNYNSRINLKLNISDTLNMLSKYLRKADTSLLNLNTRFASKLNLLDTASMLTNYLRTGVAASTYLPLTGGILTGFLKAVDSISVSNISGENAAFTINTDKSGIFNRIFQVRNTGSGVNDGAMQLYDNGIVKVNIAANNSRGGDTWFNGGGKVGIGTTTPSATFEVHGTAVFNEGSTDSDFRVESDGNPNMLFVHASTNRVGIGTITPSKTLQVQGTFDATGDITEGGNNVLTNLDTASLSSRIDLKLNKTDTASLSSRINGKVSLTGDEYINGQKTFGGLIIPSNGMQLTATGNNSNKLIGINTSSFVGEVTLGTGLSLTSNVLNATERFYFDLGTVAGQADNATGTYSFAYSGNGFIVPSSLNGYCIDTVNIRAISCTNCPPAAGEKDYYMGVYKVSAGNPVLSTGMTMQGSQIVCNEYDLKQENVNHVLTTGDVWWVYLNGSYFSDMEIIKASFIVKKTCN